VLRHWDKVRTIRVALLGLGTVGGGFVRLVEREHARIRDRIGLEIEIAAILVRDREKDRGDVDRSLITTTAVDVIDAGCDVVVELVGGVHCAGAYVRRAINNGSHVVTANKALLAATGRELFDAASANGVQIGFEASVCGGVPVVRALRRGLAGDSLESITGILNGTSNYVLSRMEDGLPFADAVKLAQEHGFAEAHPTLDLSGEDAAQKLEILTSLGFDSEVVSRSVHGIEWIDVDDVARARRRGNVFRQVAEARRVAGGVALTVAARELPLAHPLASVRDENNGVVFRGNAVGEVMLTGRGAGSLPTAAAVLSDVIEIGSA